MPNIGQALKAEIIRISRREIKSSVTSVHQSNVVLRKSVVDLRKRIATLESENKRLLKSSIIIEEKNVKAPSKVSKNVRITSSGIRKLRSKLGLSQEAFGKLLGVSTQGIYTMEHKVGRLKLRTKTFLNFLSVREMGKREALKRLEGLGKKS